MWQTGSRPTWYFLVVIYLSMFALVVGTMLYTNYVAEENNRKWCHLLVTLDESYSSTPPVSALGRKIAADIHGLRADLKCGSSR